MAFTKEEIIPILKGIETRVYRQIAEAGTLATMITRGAESQALRDAIRLLKQKERGLEFTGLFDKHGEPIYIGDKTRLMVDGEERIFDVAVDTVIRTVKCHPSFDDEYSKVAITGVVFKWNGFDLFPCVDKDGIPDNEKMEIVKDVDS